MPSFESSVTPETLDEEQETSPARYDLSYVWQKVLEHKRKLVTANVLALLATLASVPLPLLFPVLVDEVLLEKPGYVVSVIDAASPDDLHGPVLYILVVLVATLLLRLGSLILTVLQQRQFTIISKDIIYRMRRSLLKRLGRISMAEYESLGSGTVASHFVTDLDTVDRFVGATISRFLISALTLAGIAATLLWIHWQLALFILVLNPLVIYLTVRLGRWVKELKRRENAAVGDFQGALTETLDAIYQIRAGNREGYFIDCLGEKAKAVRDQAAAFAWKSDAANRFSFLVFLFGFDVFRAVAMFMVIFSSLSIGFMFAVFSYLWFMMGPIQELLAMQYAYFGARAAIGRINQLLELKEEPRFPHVSDPFKGKNTVGIRIDNIRFSYGEGPNVLDGITLGLEPGEKVAFVGASGGGKSTLVQALLGLYPTKSGDIRFGDMSVAKIGWDVVRENVAAALQHPALLNDTIRANLTFGVERSDTELWRALAIAQLDEDVAELEKGLDTVIGRQGVRFSGGQRQRLAVARLVLSEPKVVILDEATSALDTETEARLHLALSDFLQDRTTLIIAHRLSALRLADRVFVFEGGVIAEQGRHQELLDQNGVYAQLYGPRRRQPQSAVAGGRLVSGL